MTLNVWTVFAALCAVSILAGLFAGSPRGALAEDEQAAAWRSPEPPPDQDAFRRDVVSVLARSSLFGPIGEDDLLAGAAALETPAGEKALAPFPSIQSAALLDGNPVVYLSVEGRTVSASPGDKLDGDWEIIAVSLRNVRAAQGGAEQVFPIFPVGSAGEP